MSFGPPMEVNAGRPNEETSATWDNLTTLNEEDLAEVRDWQERGIPLPAGKYMLVLHRVKPQSKDAIPEI